MAAGPLVRGRSGSFPDATDRGNLAGIAASVRSDRPFSEYGLGSIESTSLATELAARFNVEVYPTEFYDHPNVRQLARHLSRRIEGERCAGGRLSARRPATRIPSWSSAWRAAFRVRAILPPTGSLLSEGRSGITSRRHDDGTVRHGGFLDDLIEFDNAFFSITNREAACMDPQQRIAMQVAWHALEDAGIKPDAIAGTDTGVFFGASAFDYGLLQLTQAELDAYSSQGSVLAVIANRIAYQLDLHGPSFVVDTACSSALTAVHLACRSLRDAECRMAIVGAVNVLLASEWDEGLIKAGMLAPDGQCKTFDASANGYVRSEGCGALVLKRYQDAVADGDRIYGAIVGSTLNQDGRSNGLTAPSGSAQEALVLSALAKANARPVRAPVRRGARHGHPAWRPDRMPRLVARPGAGSERQRARVPSGLRQSQRRPPRSGRRHGGDHQDPVGTAPRPDSGAAEPLEPQSADRSRKLGSRFPVPAWSGLANVERGVMHR